MVAFLGLYVLCSTAAAQDTLKVHFLYGSKPQKAYKSEEPKWFGGVLGGHVGIESDSGKVSNFVPTGRFHLFAHEKEKHSAYALHTVDSFYAILGGHPDSVKKTTVHIPVNAVQKGRFDSIATAYAQETPYDYALFGMRCGAATYEVLAQLGILKQYSPGKTGRKVFYPRRLRKRLLRLADKEGWLVEREAGTPRRKWERD